MATLSYNPKAKRGLIQWEPAGGGPRRSISVTGVTRAGRRSGGKPSLSRSLRRIAALAKGGAA